MNKGTTRYEVWGAASRGGRYLVGGRPGWALAGWRIRWKSGTLVPVNYIMQDRNHGDR